MSKKSQAFLLLVLAAATIGATIYKWVDEKGVTHYSETPSPKQKAQEIQVPPPPPSAGTPDGNPASKTWQEKEQEFQKRRTERLQESTKPRGTPASSDVLKFNERLMELLPPGKTLELLKAAKDKGNLGMEGGFYDFGKGVCQALSGGMDKKTLLEENYYQFWGKELSDAIYQAALDTLCPQFRK
ncbi:MAG: DUF4124 domain-containing protein [Sulfuricella sp.]